MTDRTLAWLGENAMPILGVLGALLVIGAAWSVWSLWKARPR